MKYREKQKASNNYSESGDIGCIKSHSEQKMSEMGDMGKKYSHNNPAELKESVAKLEKAVQ